MTRGDLEANFRPAISGESFYWNSTDGHCSGTEFCWMPAAERWVYRDNDAGYMGATTELTLILSNADGDESGLNGLGDLVSCEFGGGAGLWVLDSDLPEDFELPDDAEVYLVGDPSEGVKAVELTNS